MVKRTKFELYKIFLNKKTYLCFLLIFLLITTGLLFYNHLDKNYNRRYKNDIAKQISILSDDIVMRERNLSELRKKGSTSYNIKSEIEEIEKFLESVQKYVEISKDELKNYNDQKKRIAYGIKRVEQGEMLIQKGYSKPNFMNICSMDIASQRTFFLEQEKTVSLGINPLKSPYEIKFHNLIRYFFKIPSSLIWPILSFLILSINITSEFETGSYKNLYVSKDSRTCILVSKILSGFILSISFVLSMYLFIFIESIIFGDGIGNSRYQIFQSGNFINVSDFNRHILCLILAGNIILVTITNALSYINKSFDNNIVILTIASLSYLLTFELYPSVFINKWNLFSFIDPSEYIYKIRSLDISFNCLLLLSTSLVIILGNMFRFNQEDL